MGDREIPVSNRVLARHWGSYTQALHKFNLQTVRPFIDDSSPNSIHMIHTGRRFDQRSTDKFSQIEHENHLLLSKMRSIMSNQQLAVDEPFYKPSLNREFRKKEMNRIMTENERLLRSIERLPSVYDHSKLMEEEKEREKIRNNISRFGKKAKKSRKQTNPSGLHVLARPGTAPAPPIGSDAPIDVPLHIAQKRSVPMTVRPPTYHRPRAVLAPPPTFDSLYPSSLSATQPQSHSESQVQPSSPSKPQSSQPNSARNHTSTSVPSSARRPVRPSQPPSVSGGRSARLPVQPQSARTHSEVQKESHGICVFRRSGISISGLSDCTITVFEKPSPFRFDLLLTHSVHRLVPSPLVVWFSQLRQEIDYGTGLNMDLLQPQHTDELIMNYIVPRLSISGGSGDYTSSSPREFQVQYEAFKASEQSQKTNRQAESTDDANHEQLLAEARKAETSQQEEKQSEIASESTAAAEKEKTKQNEKKSAKQENKKSSAAIKEEKNESKTTEKSVSTPKPKRPSIQSPAKSKAPAVSSAAKPKAEPKSQSLTVPGAARPDATPSSTPASDSASGSSLSVPGSSSPARPFTPQPNSQPILHSEFLISGLPFLVDFAHSASTLFIKLYCRSMQFLHLFRLPKSELPDCQSALALPFEFASNETPFCQSIMKLFEVEFAPDTKGEINRNRESMVVKFRGRIIHSGAEGASKKPAPESQPKPVEAMPVVVESANPSDTAALQKSDSKSDRNLPKSVNFAMPKAAPGTVLSSLSADSIMTLIFKISVENLPLPTQANDIDHSALNPMAALYVQTSEDQPFSFVCQTERQSSSTAASSSTASLPSAERLRQPKFVRPLIIPHARPDDREYMITVYNARQEQLLTESDIIGSCLVEQRKILESLKDIKIEDAKRQFGHVAKIPLQSNGTDMEGCFVNITNIHFTIETDQTPANNQKPNTAAANQSRSNLQPSQSASDSRALSQSQSESQFSSPSSSTASLTAPVTAAVSNRGTTGIEVRAFRFPSTDHVAAIYYRRSHADQFQFLIQSDRMTSTSSPVFSPILSIDNAKCFNAELMIGFYSLHPNDQAITANHLIGSALFTLHELLVAKHLKLRLIHENKEVSDSYIVLKGIASNNEPRTPGSKPSTFIDVQLAGNQLPMITKKAGQSEPDTMIALYALQSDTGQYTYLAQSERVKQNSNPLYNTKIRLEQRGAEDQHFIFSVYDVSLGQKITENEQIGTVAMTLSQLVEAARSGQELTVPVMKEAESLPATIKFHVTYGMKK